MKRDDASARTSPALGSAPPRLPDRLPWPAAVLVVALLVLALWAAIAWAFRLVTG